MPWFWGGNNNQDDATKSLDPELRDFLNQNQPKPYVPIQLPARTEPQQPLPSSPSLEAPDTNRANEERNLPTESLFQDGRYAHLWKTYVPQSEIAAATENPIDRVVNARKHRRSSITRAALESCAFEQELQQKCLGMGMAGKLKSRMTMCQEETKGWNRCFSLQARFLQALGYMTDLKSTKEEEEKIQMHADKLYHRMMDYEAEVDEARRSDKPIPPLTSLFHPDRPAPSMDDIQLPQQMMDKMKTPLQELPAHERELAARVALTEANFGNTHAEDFFAATTTLNEDRKRRQAWLVRTLGEPVAKFLIPDAPAGPPPGSTGPPLQDFERQIWSADKAANIGSEQSKG